ncbi:MAG: mechanosensitive ion channel family protein, partial [Lachnospiraceae bacterium]|nr:mechanosensitive ion channel family protein [Lachnospiraceae bacterium]
FGIDTKTLWASAGVLSLMVGFGAKDLVNDIIAGLFLIFEGTYKIGDWVTIGTWYGVVEEIGFRYTKVRYYHETKIFNNSSIRDFINNDDDIAKELVYAPIPYETDILEIEKLLKREIPTMAAHIPQLVGLPKYQGVSSFDESCIMLRFAIYSKPSVRHSVKRAMQREIKLLFDREHISIPYKHVVVQDYKDEANTYVFAKEAGESGEESQGTKR